MSSAVWAEPCLLLLQPTSFLIICMSVVWCCCGVLCYLLLTILRSVILVANMWTIIVLSFCEQTIFTVEWMKLRERKQRQWDGIHFDLMSIEQCDRRYSNKYIVRVQNQENIGTVLSIFFSPLTSISKLNTSEAYNILLDINPLFPRYFYSQAYKTQELLCHCSSFRNLPSINSAESLKYFSILDMRCCCFFLLCEAIALSSKQISSFCSHHSIHLVVSRTNIYAHSQNNRIISFEAYVTHFATQLRCFYSSLFSHC